MDQLVTETKPNRRATKTIRYQPVPADRWGEPKWVYVAKLVIPVDGEDGYQRGEVEGHADKIAANFDPRLVGSLTVVMRRDLKNEMQVADGGNRLRAALKRGDIDKLPAYVIEVHTPAEAAAVFAHINTWRRNVLTQALHKAEVIAENPHNLRAQEILDQFDRHGVKFMGLGMLVSFCKKDESYEAVARLHPLMIAIGQQTKKNLFSTNMLKAMIRLELDMQEKTKSSLMDKKWVKRIQEFIATHNANVLAEFSDVEYRSRGNNAISLARVLCKRLNIRPNPYTLETTRSKRAAKQK